MLVRFTLHVIMYHILLEFQIELVLVCCSLIIWKKVRLVFKLFKEVPSSFFSSPACLATCASVAVVFLALVSIWTNEVHFPDPMKSTFASGRFGYELNYRTFVGFFPAPNAYNSAHKCSEYLLGWFNPHNQNVRIMQSRLCYAMLIK